ncbi:PilT protein domain protein [Pyrolobus fumarii 1A]|uniref:PilT protein domain protein n=1 Tax=Pyrolobus fumarii (strain DSM 11204 / 1A) TaxID=694429 RepID=G0EHB5_PYRF1|nr:PilT protein domain protein [Pyrolobus fumarii 1A]
MSVPRRFIDSNVFVYVLSGDSRFAQRALAILEDAEDGVYEAYTSTLVVSQVLAHLERRGRREAMEKFLEYLGDSPITVVETRLDDFTYALRLARENNLSFQKLWDDLVIASQMVRLGIREIYSNDTDFDRIPGITRLF